MKDAVKIMFIPIVGAIGIALIFLLVVFSGNWWFAVQNPDGTTGLAVAELELHDGVLGKTTKCDANLYTPVCGQDGNTYDNACFAVNAGTKVSHRGACGPR